MEVIAKFKDDSFYPQIKRKYFTMIDWFSFVGGILGLFFGFSFLSAFEIIFHASRDLFGEKNCRISRTRKLFWKRKQKVDSGSAAAYINHLCKNSSIHSFQYIFGSDFRLMER